MHLKLIRAAGLALAGLTLSGSLLTSALAGPPAKGSKKPPAKKLPVTKGAMSTQIAQGKKVYAANGCGGCHVVGGQGGKSGPELTKVGAESSHSTKWLIAHIESPRSSSGMPSYKGRIKPPEMVALVAYLGSLKK